jgi:3-phenylpropionate/trans-cinnamate dioxygenase ferredoxin reductase subunit
MDKTQNILIVGAGHAGGTVAIGLRQRGWTGSITLIGEEPLIPYQRPPLSKAWLRGNATADSLALRPAEFYQAQGITLHISSRVASLDRAARQVVSDDGHRRGYDKLILAIGARARRIPLAGSDLEGVCELRTAADADRLKWALGPGKRLAVIGAGYVGLEAAASARSLGTEVVVIEREPRVLARIACPVLSDFFQSLHVAHGVKFELGAGIAAIEGDSSGAVAGVRLADDRLLPCDVVLVGVGAEPNIDLAAKAGLTCDRLGIVVDLAARTSDADIYAIGDCTSRPLPLYGNRSWRLESVPNAQEQAGQAAADLCGLPPPNPEVPWFWSDQYDAKLQIAGLPLDVASVVVRGAPESGRFAVFHLDQANRLRAVEAVNAVGEFMTGRKLIASREVLSVEKLRDLQVPIKEVAA